MSVSSPSTWGGAGDTVPGNREQSVSANISQRQPLEVGFACETPMARGAVFESWFGVQNSSCSEGVSGAGCARENCPSRLKGRPLEAAFGCTQGGGSLDGMSPLWPEH